MKKLIHDVSAYLILFTIIFTACTDNVNKERQPRNVRVKTITVDTDGVTSDNNYSGTVEETSGTVVSFSTPGTIKTLNVEEGDNVKKGQLIGTLDDGTLKNSYEIALSTLNQAKDAYRRMKILHDANSLPEIKWVDVESKLRQAESAAEIARIALDNAKLYAPVSGIITDKTAAVGQNVAPGIPIVKIIDINKVKVAISVPENEIGTFATGNTAEITSGNKTYQGKIVEKGVVANPLSRSYMVKYQIDNPNGELLPGMICSVKSTRTSQNQGILLPASAILLASDNSNFVWLDSAGMARKRTVSISIMLPEGIIIDAGLHAGDKVIIAGMEKVSQNTHVTSIN